MLTSAQPTFFDTGDDDTVNLVAVVALAFPDPSAIGPYKLGGIADAASGGFHWTQGDGAPVLTPMVTAPSEWAQSVCCVRSVDPPRSGPRSQRRRTGGGAIVLGQQVVLVLC